MKKRFLVFGTIAILLLATVFSYGCQQAGSSVLYPNQQQGISVTGEGKVTVAPDVAIIQLGIQAQANTVAEAQAQAAKAMNDVKSALTNNGIAENDIQTQYYNIQQLTRWDADKQEQVTIGYQVNNVVSAKIREVTKAGAVIDAVTLAGGDLTRVNSIQFTIDDPTVSYDLAREKAMADAKDTATQLAKLAGVKLGTPIYISESGASVPPIYARGVAEAKDASTPISPGELEISLTVQVNYAIQ